MEPAEFINIDSLSILDLLKAPIQITFIERFVNP